MPSPTLSVFHSDFFRHNVTFFEVFGFHQIVSPLFVSIFCNTIDSKKIPFYIFWHCDTVQKSHLKIFPKGPPLFFSYFATNWSFQSPKGPPFTILSLRYSADFGRSRLVQSTIKHSDLFGTVYGTLLAAERNKNSEYGLFLKYDK